MDSQEIEDLFSNSGVVDFDPKGHYFTVNDPHKIYRIIQDKIQTRENKMLEFVIGEDKLDKSIFSGTEEIIDDKYAKIVNAEKAKQRQRAKEWRER